MVAEPWLLKMGNQVSNNFKNSTLLHQISTKKKDPSPKIKQIIGILSFEIANIMSKLAYLHKSVCDTEISKLRNEIIKSEGVKKLVSFDESYLIELAYVERLDDLNSIAEVVSRLGKKCSEPVLLGFEHVYGDIISGKIEVKELGFLVKDMESMIRKMERYVDATTKLYRELEVLSELEESTKKFHLNQNVDCRRAFEQKVTWQRQDVRHLKEVSLWNLTYDKVVELLARTVCTLYARICFVFGNGGDGDLTRSCSRSVLLRSPVSVGGGSRTVSGVLVKVDGSEKDMNVEDSRILRPLNRFKASPIDSLQKRETDFVFPCAPSPGRIFAECLSFSTSASRVDDEDDDFTFNDVKKVQLPYSMDVSRVGAKGRLVLHATLSTVGGSALALHYANVIIVIEKLLRYPHLVGEEARDDLYQMLPHSLRKSLRVNLKSHCKNFAIYDGALAHDWKETLDGILRWLAPLAHNMIRWQSERSVEQQQIVTRTNVLLLQTLYFADREKTEAAICDLLVGLNYICRYEHQQNALLDCAASFDFGDWMEWQLQLQCQDSCLN